MLRALSVQKVGLSSLSTWNKWYRSCPISSRIVFIKTDSSPLDIAHWNPNFHHNAREETQNDSVTLAKIQSISYFKPIQRYNSRAAKLGSLDQLIVTSDLQKKIDGASDIPSLLGLFGSDAGDIFVDNRAKPNLLVHWLRRLNEIITEQGLTQDDLDVVKSHEDFQKLLHQLDRNMTKMRSTDVLNGLTHLLDIFPDDNLTIESFENHIRWLLRKMYLTNVERVLLIHEKHQETVLRQDMLKFIQAIEEKRWGELLDPADVIALMYDKPENVSDRFEAKLEEKALDLCGQMSTKNLYRLIYQLAKKKRRNTPLLRGAMYYLGCQPSISLSPVHLMNLLFALTSFKLYHPVLFEKLAESVISEMNHFQPHMMSSVLTSIGVAKFRHPKLLDSLTEYFHERVDTVSPSDLSSLVITLANLNYQPQTLSEYFPTFLSRLRPLEIGDRKTWLDVVWSAAILNRLSAEMAESVLKPEFYSGFSELESFRALPCHLKLANISAIVKYDLPNYSGPKLPDDYLQTKDLSLAKRSERPFHTMILETLLNFAPGEKYAATSVLTPSGSTIDVELVTNQQGEVLPLTDYKPGEAQAFRIALRVNDFQDMTIYTVVPNGVSVMTARLLKELGYKTVEVTYYDFPIKGTVVNKVAYLQGKLKEAVQ